MKLLLLLVFSCSLISFSLSAAGVNCDILGNGPFCRSKAHLRNTCYADDRIPCSTYKGSCWTGVHVLCCDVCPTDDYIPDGNGIERALFDAYKNDLLFAGDGGNGGNEEEYDGEDKLNQNEILSVLHGNNILSSTDNHNHNILLFGSITAILFFGIITYYLYKNNNKKEEYQSLIQNDHV